MHVSTICKINLRPTINRVNPKQGEEINDQWVGFRRDFVCASPVGMKATTYVHFSRAPRTLVTIRGQRASRTSADVYRICGFVSQRGGKCSLQVRFNSMIGAC